MTNQEAITKLTNIMHDDHYSWHPSILTAFNMAVDALKGVEGDCISRERLKESLLSEDYETHDFCFPCKEIMKRIDEQPSAQPTHNNTSNALKSLDCIDRQDAIDGKISIQRSNGLEIYSDEAVPVEYLKKLPSAQPERNTGKWIFIGDGYKCSKCRSVYSWWADSQTSNYCPNCGADMREGETDGCDS